MLPAAECRLKFNIEFVSAIFDRIDITFDFNNGEYSGILNVMPNTTAPSTDNLFSTTYGYQFNEEKNKNKDLPKEYLQLLLNLCDDIMAFHRVSKLEKQIRNDQG